jgi:hypothetical protein
MADASTALRREDRKPFVADVDLIVGGRSRWARGCNISRHGACVSCQIKVERGDALQVDLTSQGMGVRAAIVRHSALDNTLFLVGVEFFEPLSLDEVDALANA